jgi:hypothetical protein
LCARKPNPNAQRDTVEHTVGDPEFDWQPDAIAHHQRFADRDHQCQPDEYGKWYPDRTHCHAHAHQNPHAALHGYGDQLGHPVDAADRPTCRAG